MSYNISTIYKDLQKHQYKQLFYLMCYLKLRDSFNQLQLLNHSINNYRDLHLLISHVYFVS